MSRSSLWVMDKEFNGSELVEFSNAWLFAPIAWDVLFQKYMPEKVEINFMGSRTTYMSAIMFDNTVERELNKRINACEEMVDRLVWELSMMQVFNIKDKMIVANAVGNFLELNKEFAGDCGEHIFERFVEVAEAIQDLDEEEHAYFIHKGTSVDDNVEFWFEKYNEESEEHEPASLQEMDRHVAEFVIIEDGLITGFKSNLEFFGKQAS